MFGAPSLAGIDPADANDPDFKASMRGWENPAVVDEYVRLTKFLAQRWRDRVRWWVTVNEPVGSMIAVGYFAGVWSPGFVADGDRGKKAYFNLLKAHLRAYETIKATNADAQVGFAHAMMFAKTTYEFADDLANDQDAARNQFDYFYNWHMLNAVINGELDQNIERRPADREASSAGQRSRSGRASTAARGPVTATSSGSTTTGRCTSSGSRRSRSRSPRCTPGAGSATT